MTEFTYEIHECDPQSERLFVVYHIDGEPDIPMAVTLSSDSEWTDHDIQVRIWQTMGQVEELLRRQKQEEAVKAKRRTAAECSHLVGMTFKDVFNPQTMLVGKPPNYPDHCHLTHEVKPVSLFKRLDDAEWEVVELSPEESEKRTFSWRKDTMAHRSEIFKQLHAMGRLAEAEEAIKLSPEDVQIDWNHAISLHRTGPVQEVIQDALGLSESEMDEIWLAGEKEIIERRMFGAS